MPSLLPSVYPRRELSFTVLSETSKNVFGVIMLVSFTVPLKFTPSHRGTPSRKYRKSSM